MNLDELRPILAGYRAQVETAWSPATAHPNYDGKAGDPAGQCGVTSAWLQRRLREDHGIETTYCVGNVACGFHDERLEGHCWLEIADNMFGRVVIDLTADQCPCLPVLLLWSRARLEANDARYAPVRRLSEEQVSRDRVASRLAILTEALS